jgi:hypothetical protein
MNRRSRTTSIAVALACTMALAACGGGSSPAPGAGATDPPPTPAAADPTTEGGGGIAASCATLLPTDEVQTILGVPPEPVDERTYPGSLECTWSYAEDGAAVQDFLQVIINTNAGDAALWEATKDAEADSDSETPIAIDGIGDASYTWTGQGDYRKLYVRRGDATLIIRASSALPVLSTESTMIDFADRLFGRS